MPLTKVPCCISAESLKTIISLLGRTRQSMLSYGFELLNKNVSTTEMDSLQFQSLELKGTYINFNMKKMCSLILTSGQPRN